MRITGFIPEKDNVVQVSKPEPVIEKEQEKVKQIPVKKIPVKKPTKKK